MAGSPNQTGTLLEANGAGVGATALPRALGRVAAAATDPPPAIEARLVSRSFDGNRVLNDVSLSVEPGRIRALLGPNGAGKTTLLRILSGLTTPESGSVRITGLDPVAQSRLARRRLGLIPSGDRTFYLRLSGLENLVFFARLHGMSRRQALQRAGDVLEQVDLDEAARRPVQNYSHGMQKRLSVARALLTEPSVFLIDEATHDLDPTAARRVMDLIENLVGQGAAVVWATQRLDEIRGFAHGVTLLTKGNVRFSGTVPELMSHAVPRRFLLRVRNGRPDHALEQRLAAALAGRGFVETPSGESSGHYTMCLGDDVVLGDALAALTAANVQVLACREERSEIEEAFLLLMNQEAR
jgi:ABC-type multidrug transport system ATPase subunit